MDLVDPRAEQDAGAGLAEREVRPYLGPERLGVEDGVCDGEGRAVGAAAEADVAVLAKALHECCDERRRGRAPPCSVP